MKAKILKRLRLGRWGFSLLEMMAVIGILALLTGAFLTVASTRKESQNLSSTATQLDAIEKALLQHFKLKGYLPGPARRTDAESAATFGVAVTYSTATPAGIVEVLSGGGTVGVDEIRIGVVPTRTLGLPDTYMFDEWGNRILYAVVKELTRDSTAVAGCIGADADPTPAECFEDYATTLTTGVIEVNDTAGNQVNEGNIDTMVTFVLASHGKDGKGAWNRRGSAVTCGASGEDDAENCDFNDAIFVDADINDSTTAASYYYDLMRWKEKQTVQTAITQPPPPGPQQDPPPPAFYTALAGGGQHTCGLRTDGTVYCWGDNFYGQLGDGTTTDSVTPVRAGTLTAIIQIDAGQNHTCALKGDGSVYCWGKNGAGELGDDSTTTSATPRQVCNAALCADFLQNAIQVSAGGNHSCAVADDSGDAVYEAWCWGEDSDGEVGNNSSAADELFAVQVVDNPTTGKLLRVTAIAAGGSHTCAVADHSNDGVNEAWCWGNGAGGKRGDDTTTTPKKFPVQVCAAAGCAGKLLGVSAITAGQESTCAAAVNAGTGNAAALHCWGQQENGQIANGDDTAGTNKLPVQIAAIDGSAAAKKVVSLSNNLAINHDNHACAVLLNNSLYCWGRGLAGRLADGDVTAHNQDTVLLTKLDAVTNFNATLVDTPVVTTGDHHTCAVVDIDGDADNEAYCWGEDGDSQLGDGATVDQGYPVLLAH